MIRIDELTEENHSIVAGFWASHEWPAIPLDLLPKRSYIVFVDEKPIIFGAFYKDDSSRYALLDWIVSNKEATKEERIAAFPALMNKIDEVCKELNVKLMFTMASHDGLISRLLKSGFVGTDHQVSILMKEIQHAVPVSNSVSD